MALILLAFARNLMAMFIRIPLRWSLIVVCIVLLTAMSFPAPADTNADTNVVAALIAADASLSQGVIVYLRKSKGVIVYLRKSTGKVSSQSNGKTSYRCRGKIIYLPNGRFEEDLDLPDQDSHCVTYWDGENTISKANNADKLNHALNNVVAINPTMPTEMLPNTFPIMLRPGPSFVLGRGLSLLKGLHTVSVSSKAVTVAGTYGDVSAPATVTADLDPQNDLVAKHVEIDFPAAQADKPISATWTFGLPMRATSGQIIASSATYDFPERNYRDHYVIQYANFARPTLFIPTSLPAGSYVADMRVGQKVFLHLARARTLDQILAVTRRQAAQLAATDVQGRAAEEANKRRSVVSHVLMVVLVVTVVSQLVIVWRRRKRPASTA